MYPKSLSAEESLEMVKEKLFDDPAGNTCTEPKFISQQEGQRIVKTAKDWEGTEYVYGGATKKGADCSGTTWSIYKEAGFPYSIKYRPSSQFSRNPQFKPAPNNEPQEGDVGWWNGHVVIYAGNGGIWTATHTGGKPYKKDFLHKWVRRKGAVKWYRYCK
jgi:cell wall-associated NlpC family hydrolase